ncbi:MAG: alpha/beta hydrolase [Bacteroidota bacterium]
MIIHHVVSSRPLVKDGDHFKYKRGLIPLTPGMDNANTFLNFGHYLVEKNDIDPPVFKRNGDSSETNHFHTHEGDFYLPGEESEPWFNEIFTELKKEREKQLYIYLFGFGNTVNQEMKKQLSPLHSHYFLDDWGLNSPVGKILLISWPSQGKLQYKKGELNDVEKMGKSVAVLLLKLFHYVNNKNNPLFSDWNPKIVMHTQSMGCRILKQAVKTLNDLENAGKIKADILNNFFHRLILTGADIDEDGLSYSDAEDDYFIHQLAHRVVLFHNKNDFALWMSNNIFGTKKQRLGRTETDIKKMLPKNVDLIQLSRKGGAGLVGHSYFQDKSFIIEKLFSALGNQHADGTTLADGKNRAMELECEPDSIKGEWIG